MKLNRKKTLITSLVVMILCMVLLAGSTYAAFNDTANASLTITSATFDMQVAVWDGEKYVTKTEGEEANIVLDTLTIDGSWTEKTYFLKVTNASTLDFAELLIDLEKQVTTGSDAGILEYYTYSNATDPAGDASKVATQLTATELSLYSAALTSGSSYYVALKVKVVASTIATAVGVTLTMDFVANQVAA